jgi:hypothetical protein
MTQLTAANPGISPTHTHHSFVIPSCSRRNRSTT